MKTKPFTLYILAIILFSSCYVAKPIINVTPKNSEEVIWELGEAVISYTQDSIQMDIAYHRSSDKYIIFKTRFINNSNQSIHVDPKNCFLDIELINKQTTRLPILDPEKKVFAQQLAMAKQEARVKNAAVWFVVDVAASVVAGGDTFESEQNMYNAEDRLYNVREELINWSGDLLRKTDLEPNYYVDGFLFFKRNETAKNITLNFEVENIMFKISYVQQLKGNVY